MKKTFISFLAVLLCLNATAQSNFYKMSLGAGYGFTQSFADLQSHDFSMAAYGTADYFFTPFISVGGELQMGKIRGGVSGNDPHGRAFINSYKAATVNGKLYLGLLVDPERGSFLDKVKWFYGGVGAGVIRNKMTGIIRRRSDGYFFPGSSSSTELVVPLNLGINFYFRDYAGLPKFGINVNYQTNITLGEGLDGYNDSPIRFKSGSPDIYTYLSVGVRYHFGQIGLAKKSLY